MTTQITNTQVKLVMTGKIQNGNVTIQTDPIFAAIHQLGDDPGLLTPFQVGVLDADEKMPFCPEDYFFKAVQKLEYAMGFASIRPDCEPAQDMICKIEAALLAQLADERDEAYDRQYPV